ncbi:MAG: hypothetical protein GXP27_07275 [Planctomycetes bacterium]|nr:hypothetical protein [Planctomycetota bacterium]
MLSFPVEGRSGPHWHLTRAKLREYQECYPSLDVLAEARKALQWIRDNPARRKTARGMPRFLTNWLNRALERPRGREPPRRKLDIVAVIEQAKREGRV